MDVKEEISTIKQINSEATPIVSLSVTNLDIEVEEGKVYKDSFFIESENKVPIEGYVCTTSDKVETEAERLEGTRQEIPFYFKGKLATAGNTFEGDIVLITNGGEYNIPYCVKVIRKFVESSGGRISTMEEFVQIYENNRKEAVDIFFLPNFEEVFLQGKPEQKELYHSLMKSRSKSLILEEFLTAAGYKNTSFLDVSQDKLVLEEEDSSAQLELLLTHPGYVEGSIYSEKGQIQISRERFSSDDFTDGKLLFNVEKKQNLLNGSDIIHIDTVRQDIEISVEWWAKQTALTKEKEKKLYLKKKRAQLSITICISEQEVSHFEDFAEDSGHVLEELSRYTEDNEWKLYRMHFFLMEERKEEGKELLELLEKVSQRDEFTPLEANYFLYLKAMYYRTPEAISKAVSTIREFYELSEYKAEALWMLIYLDREYVYNKRLQYDTIRQLFEEGNNSSLLYFEACDILNENPNYMEELGKFEISIFRWGVRYGYISLSLSYQFARLALKAKYYNKSIYYIAEKLYGVEPDEQFLQVICSLLIKGNRTGKEYHEYFRLAVEANLKIIGLNEFFIRSMDFETYDLIPQRVLSILHTATV